MALIFAIKHLYNFFLFYFIFYCIMFIHSFFTLFFNLVSINRGNIEGTNGLKTDV